MTDDITDISGRLQEAVSTRHVTGGELAEVVKASPAAVSQWLSGKKQPTRENVRALAEALGVKVEWLELGLGQGPERNLDEERKAHVAAASWGFRPQPADGGRDYGNANIWSFLPNLDTFARETGQNIVDVRREATAEAIYRLIVLRGDDLARFQAAVKWADLRSHLEAATRGTQKIGRFLTDGLGQIDKDGELLLLRIEDRGSTGLTGEEFEPGNFMALCRNNLDSHKSAATAGGAFGLGKAALWLTSHISTVLFNSHLSEATEAGSRLNRIFGRVELGWHEVSPDAFAGPGWFGRMDPHRACAVSYWDNEALAEDLFIDRETSDPGTSILVVGFHDPTGESDQPAVLAERLEASLAQHFFPAIISGRLRAVVELYEGRTLKSSITVDPAKHVPEFSALLTDYGAGTVDTALTGPGDSAQHRVALQVPARRAGFDNPHRELTHETILLVRAAEDPEATLVNRVALYRGPGMVVRYLDLTNLAGARPFHAVVLCGEAAGSAAPDRAAERFLRAAEPPSHNDWSSTQDLKVEYAVGGKKSIDDFRMEVTRVIKELVSPTREDLDDGPRALKELLRIKGEPPEPPRQPRIVDPTGTVDSNGAWVIEATIRVKPGPNKTWRGRPVAIFNAETGPGQPVTWANLEALRGCRREGDVLVIPPGTREAHFRGTTDPVSHPVPAMDSTLTVDSGQLEENVMTRLYPYALLFGDLNLTVVDVTIDNEKPDTHIVDLNGDGLDLYLVERHEWEKVAFKVEVDGPPSGIQVLDDQGGALAMTAVVQCGATNMRVAVPLQRSVTDPARWAGDVLLTRRNFAGAAELHAALSGTAGGREWRLLKASNVWELRFDEPSSPPIEGSVDVRWVHFRGDDAPPQVLRYATEAFYVDLAAAPVVLLNLDFEGLQAILEDRPRIGPDAALHQAVRASIATKVWAAMFNAALDTVIGEMDPAGDGEPEASPSFPGVGWQSQVLQRVLAVMYEDRSPGDALAEVVRLWQSEEGAYAVHSEITAAVEKHIDAGKLLRRAARIVYGDVA